LGAQGVLSTDSLLTVTTSGIYIAIVSDNFGTAFSDTVSVTVLPKPTAYFTQSSMDICYGDSAYMGIVFGGTPPFIYSIKENGITATDTAFANFVSFSKAYSNSTTVIITSLSDYSGCVYVEDFDTLQVTVNALPTVSISGLASSYCSGASPVTIGTSPSGGTLTGQGIVGNDFYPAFSTVGTHSIIYSYTDNNGCINKDTASVIVNATPDVYFTSNLNNSYCHDGDTVNLTAVPTGGTFSGSGVTANVFDPSQAIAGSVDVVYSYTDANGCGDSDTLHTTVYSLPIVTLSPLGSSCANGSPITLSGGSPSGGSYTGPGVIQGIFYPNLAVLGSDTIIYEYSDIHGCYNNAEQTITVNPVPVASLSLPATICKGDTANISFTGTSTATTSWDFDGGQTLSGTGNGPYGISWSASGAKAVKVVASENGCNSDTVFKLINVLSSYAQITAVGNTSVCHGDSVILFANSGIGFSYQF